MVKIKSQSKSPYITFESEKTRDIEPFKFISYFEIKDDVFRLIPCDQQSGEKAPKLGDAQKHILSYLHNNGPSLIAPINQKLSRPNLKQSEMPSINLSIRELLGERTMDQEAKKQYMS